MSMKTSSAIAMMTFAAGLTASPVLAETPAKIGDLSCSVDSVDKKLFKSEIVLDCTYNDANGNPVDMYRGSINRTGLDIGNMKTTSFGWIVARVGDVSDVNLEGTYVGAQVGASVGAGGGANWMTGGINDSISLQPWSGEGKSGLGVELGGQKLKLTKK